MRQVKNNHELVKELSKKIAEIRAPRRVYCSVPTCSTFILEGITVGNLTICPACSSTTCVECKAPEHDGECEEDEAEQEVLRLAEAEGWKRCPRCRSIIENVDGCSEMV